MTRVKCKRTAIRAEKNNNQSRNAAREALVRRPWLLHITDGIPTPITLTIQVLISAGNTIKTIEIVVVPLCLWQ